MRGIISKKSVTFSEILDFELCALAGDPQTPANHPPTTRAPPGNPPARAEAGAPVPGPPGSPSAAYLDLTRPAGSRRIGRGAGRGKSRKSTIFQIYRSPRPLVGFLRFWMHCRAGGMCFRIKRIIFIERLATGRGLRGRGDREI